MDIFRATLKLEPLLNYLPTSSIQFELSERLSISELSDNSSATPDLLSPTNFTFNNQSEGQTKQRGSKKSPQENRMDMMERLKRLQETASSGQQPAPELSFAPAEETEGGVGGTESVSDSKTSLSSGGGGGHCVGVSSGMEWIVKRMYAMCAEISASYVQVRLIGYLRRKNNNLPLAIKEIPVVLIILKIISSLLVLSLTRCRQYNFL